MVATLEEVTKPEMVEFTGQNFNFNGYCDAKYRVSTSKCKVGNIEVPVRLEALNEEGKWKQHPVVFIHYGSYEARKNSDGILVMFLPDGKYISRPYIPLIDRDLYEQAERIGLTRGDSVFVRAIVREEE